MKKLIILLSVCLLSVGVNASSLQLGAGLTMSEYSTIEKLYDDGVFTKLRTTAEWQAPMRTIDVASAVIKSNSSIHHRIDGIEKMAYRFGRQLSNNIQSLDAKNDTLFSENLDLKKKIKKLENDQATLGLFAFFGVIAGILL